VFWGDFVRREPAHFARDMQQLTTWYAAGKVRPVLDHPLPLSELMAAYARMGARQVIGKLVLTQV
jgi:NADPH2:quinone reductase